MTRSSIKADERKGWRKSKCELVPFLGDKQETLKREQMWLPILGAVRLSFAIYCQCLESCFKASPASSQLLLHLPVKSLCWANSLSIDTESLWVTNSTEWLCCSVIDWKMFPHLKSFFQANGHAYFCNMECRLFIYLTLVSATFQLAQGGLTTFMTCLLKLHTFFPLPLLLPSCWLLYLKQTVPAQ